MNVPFLDLKTQHARIRDEIRPVLDEVIDCCAFSGGPYVADFEKAFADYCGTDYAVGVSSGTEALWVALQCLGIGRGDEVITAPNSFIATAEAISFCGATPVFADVDRRTYTLDPAKVEAAVTPRTRAVIPVHLYGQMADMGPIMETARKHGLFVIEDACQAHGATYKGQSAGSIGDAGAFSFYPGKNLGAFGEGGAVTTSSAALASAMQAFKDHGSKKKYEHQMIGWNCRLGGIQGAVLGVKLRHLPAWNESRQRSAALYRELLGGIEGAGLPVEAGYGSHVYHLFVIRTKDRDGLMEHLNSRGVQCGIHYPVPIHLHEAYKSLGIGEGSFPVSEEYAGEIVSLPMFPDMTEEQVTYAAGEVQSFLENR